LLRLENVTKTYSKNSIKAVDNINLEIEKGEVFGFLGPNGAGKTTTIKMIVGLLKPDNGKITVNGIDVWQNPIEAKKLMSYVPDDPELYNKLKGIEYLNFVGDIYEISKEERIERIEKYLDIFELKGAIKDTIGSYSHGMKQKLALISALIHEPEILILDEPMVGLDPKSAFNLKEIMRDMCNKGKTVFFSTHILEVAEKICDRIGIIKEGNIIALGTMEELRHHSAKEESLEEIFLELTE